MNAGHDTIRTQLSRCLVPAFDGALSAPGTEGFRQEYDACKRGEAAPAIDVGAERVRPGTFDDLLRRYYRSPDFLDPSDRTRVVYRGVLERWRVRERKGVR